jgi:hypothetical protein
MKNKNKRTLHRRLKFWRNETDDAARLENRILRAILRNLGAAIAALFCCSLSAAELYWDANPTSEGVESYRVYAARGSDPLAFRASTTGTNFALTNFTAGVWRFAVTALAGDLESAQSETVTWTNAPSTPQLRIKVTLQSKADLSDPWREEFQFVSVAIPDGRQFYRASLEVER